MKIYTIGHSTRRIDEFIDLLQNYNITQLIDVRRFPGSRHRPEYNSDNLKNSLIDHNISYHHIVKLGGRRKPHKDSMNTAWRNTSFRGYADHMQTAEFAEGIAELISLAEGKTTVLMCAEAVPWRCHRSLIGDALLVRGHRVFDIFNKKKAQEEKLTSFAKRDGLDLTYPSTILTSFLT